MTSAIYSALTGEAADQYFNDQERVLRDAAGTLKIAAQQLPERVTPDRRAQAPETPG
jgi:hypothetical protein